MATKTISVDMEAYRRLKAVRKPNESFSGVIKRVIRLPLDVERYLARIEEQTLSKDAAHAVQAHIEMRHASSGRRR